MATSSHVLVIGIDGVRYDVLQEVATPNIDAIGRNGFLRPVVVNRAAPTISGPSWTTMVTGVLAPIHQVFGNDFSSARLAACPDFVSLARDTHPGIPTYVGADWEPLVTSHSGGPLFGGGGYLPDRRRDASSTPRNWHDSDQDVADQARQFLGRVRSDSGSVSFVYQHGPDTAGHQTGVSDLYREFIEASDTRVGQLVEAVRNRPQYTAERWLIVVATDHGHVDAGGHGGDTPAEREAWIAAEGADVPLDDEELILEQADVAGHVAHVLDLPRPGEGVGVPFGTRKSAA
ncbi:putative AlkP superfamily pyrophosphatase or phosphodiesterase [Kribbella aluminosa]|uniref:AlkP superfamily pyrophosphatase or phosphodiesterase n=1 Tax=Kribbella aluminosa TaxID=416017 RepID=A0ABS4UWY8_9ACTN|nr:alkaline phosphatase family protein [Kribbella aluminosa]MBP2356147.1 putative AlkP superfamily pyrophosphatase or phosphodiesterase [Kribbella aluminosa]